MAIYNTLTAGEVNRRFTTSPAFSKEGFGEDCIHNRHVAGSLSRIMGSAFVYEHKKASLLKGRFGGIVYISGGM